MTVAFWLQCALVFTLLVLTGVAVASAVRYSHLIDQAALGTNPDPDDVSFERSTNVDDALFATVPLVVLAGWLGLTAFWVRRGSAIARILTWVALGTPTVLGVLFCLLGALIGVVGFAVFSTMPDEDHTIPGTFPDEGGSTYDSSGFYDRLTSGDGGGLSTALGALGATSAVLALLLAVAVAVLLMTGQANRYFRPQGARPRHPGTPFWYAGQPVTAGYPHSGQPPYSTAVPSDPAAYSASPYQAVPAPFGMPQHPPAPAAHGATPYSSGPVAFPAASYPPGTAMPYPPALVPFAAAPYPSGAAPSGVWPYPSGAAPFGVQPYPPGAGPFPPAPYPPVAAAAPAPSEVARPVPDPAAPHPPGVTDPDRETAAPPAAAASPSPWAAPSVPEVPGAAGQDPGPADPPAQSSAR